MLSRGKRGNGKSFKKSQDLQSIPVKKLQIIQKWRECFPPAMPGGDGNSRCKGSAPTKNSLEGPPTRCSACQGRFPLRGGACRAAEWIEKAALSKGEESAAGGSGPLPKAAEEDVAEGRWPWFRKTEKRRKELPHLPCTECPLVPKNTSIVGNRGGKVNGRVEKRREKEGQLPIEIVRKTRGETSPPNLAEAGGPGGGNYEKRCLLFPRI